MRVEKLPRESNVVLSTYCPNPMVATRHRRKWYLPYHPYISGVLIIIQQGKN